jgi:putative N6-adenine-specific DNA methylase
MLTPDLKLPGKMRLKEVAPRADVERPHRMPAVPLRHGQGHPRERPNKAEGGGAQHAG